MTGKAEQIKALREFVPLVRDLLHSEEFRQMKGYTHHVRGNLYDHSLKVAYLCFRHHRRFRMRGDPGELVRGAALHDYYLYNLHGEGTPHRLHWFRHPREALRRALEKYPHLTERQRDMILHHMFPVTPVPPRTVAGWLVCFYDKVAAVSDRFGGRRGKGAEARGKKAGRRRFITFQKQILSKTKMARGYHNTVNEQTQGKQELMESTGVFTYQYSAKQSKEIRRIREKYLPREESKLERLRRLDGRVQSAGMVPALCLGIVGCLTFGLGMCFGLGVFAGGPWLAALLCVPGAAAAVSAYPVLRYIAAKTKARLAPEILRLTDEIAQNEKI